MSKDMISLFITAFLIAGSFILALPENGYSGIAEPPTGCCIGPNDECVNFGDLPVACLIDSVVENGTCSVEGPGGICAPGPAPIPTLSEWGLIAMAGVLGMAGFLIIRKRKV
ncbi:MAG TPA: IPTL-CTERM sorting domain-containing protein, partial [Thermodesulfobacteriota bacterium]|nr:IPTL-CTERM sorting domain-containing protein [Thermodesulfobacteriota bacterium]